LLKLELNNCFLVLHRAVLPADHPAYGRIVRVANKILKSNLDLAEIKKKNWTVTVIDEVFYLELFFDASAFEFLYFF
jgi:hypothetical protein